MTSNLGPLSQGVEFDKIRRIWETLGSRASGGGDDCSIVRVGNEQLAFSTDMMVENTHFKSGWLSPNELGWRAGAAALSDLAAVVADPVGVLVSLGLPSGTDDDFASDLMDGLGSVADSVAAAVWGGDLVRSERLVIDVVVVGRVTKPVLRSGASEGDTLWVTGRLGGPAAAVRSWNSGRTPEGGARSRFARPEPRVEPARWLRDHGANALIDLSDGLLADAGQLASASGVACVIESARVPILPEVELEAAVVGGEEFELFVAMPSGFAATMSGEFENKFGLPLTGVGHVEAGEGVRVLEAGVPMNFDGGFRHFEE